MRVELFGNPPEHVRQLIHEVGLKIEAAPGAAGLAWPDADGLAALRRLAEEGDPGLAIIETEEQFLSAAVSGAAAVIDVSTPQRMRLEIECHLRYRRRVQEQHRNLEQRINELSERLFSAMSVQQKLVASSPSPVICSDMSGQVTVFNHVAEDVLGYDADYACSQMHVTDIYANPADAGRVLAEVRCTDERLVRELQVRLRARSGEQIPMYISAAEVRNTAGESMALVCVFEDRRIEAGLRQRLRQAKQQIRRSEQRADEITAARVAAHELNQPLTALMGAIELLEMQEEVLPDAVRRRMDQMFKQMERMAEIVRGLGEQSEHLDAQHKEA